MGARNSVMVGAAGEDFVLYQLHVRDLLAAQAPPNAYAADIVVFSPRMSVGSMIQVKTRTAGRDGGWHMQPKHERLVHDRLFYVFVDLEAEPPVCYVMPSEVVARVVTDSHSAWLAAPGKRGQPHRDSKVRRIRPAYEQMPGWLKSGWLDEFRERWDLVSDEPPVSPPTPDAPGSSL
jgi:hypothetical protein